MRRTMPRRRTAADRARERADRDNLASVLIALQAKRSARTGVPVPTKPSNDPEAVARLQAALAAYARKPPGTFMRDVRAYLRSPETTEPKA
jgi:hypothetical protein